MSLRVRLGAMVAITLALHIGFMLTAARSIPQLRGPQMGWQGYDIAENLVEGRGYRGTVADIEYRAYRPPVFPVLIAGLMVVFGKGYGPVQAALAVSSAVCAVVVFFLTRRIWGERVATIAGFWAALNPSAVYSSAWPSPENLNAVLLVASFAVLWRVRNGGRAIDAVGGGVLLGLTALTRISFLVLPALAVPWLFMQGGDRRGAARSGALLCAGFLAVLAPWIARNQAVFGTPRLMTGDGPATFYWASTPSWLLGEVGKLKFPPVEYTERLPEIAAMEELERGRWYIETARASIRAHPGAYAKRVVHRVWLLWKPYPHLLGDRSLKGILRGAAMSASFAPLLLLFLVGAWWLRREWRMLSLVHAVLLAVTASGALAHAVIRYRVPLEPLMIPIAAYALDRIVDRWRARRAAAAGT